MGKICSRCDRQAIYHRAYSGEYLCVQCFKRSVEEKVVRTISKFGMLRYGDKILLMVSGGKDSMSMLRILSKVVKSHASEVLVATIDEGIEGYRRDAIEISAEACAKLNVSHHVFSFKDLFGYPMDQIELLKEGMSSCSVCGVLRRRAMDIAAQKLNVNVVATAHNLDDIIQTFLINLLNNDIKRLIWNLPVHHETYLFSQKRIKPLAEIYEEELALYAFLNKERFQEVSCPYMHEGIRTKIRSILNELETNHPGIKYSFFNSAIKIPEIITTPTKERKNCEKCGYPTFANKCSVCSILDLLNRKNIRQK
ncbi:MAG: TIGR00269 family protein [Nitrososphaeria archaeon]